MRNFVRTLRESLPDALSREAMNKVLHRVTRYYFDWFNFVAGVR